MSRVRRVLVPLSVTTALLLSGLQVQAFAVPAKPPKPSAAADLQGWRSQSNQPNPELNSVLPAGVASNEQAPSPVKRDGRRVKELTARRTPTSKVFQLADGRTEAELSSEPVNFQAADGTLQPIDTTVKASRAAGFGLANETNSFRSFFGNRADQLVRFDLDGRGLTLGAPDGSKALSPKVSGDTVTYPDVFGDADLVYQVGPDQLKESIVLASAPADPTYRFSLKLAGVKAAQQPDGSIVFSPQSGVGRPLFTMPRPFMTDARDDAASPYGKAFSDKVTQTVTQRGANIDITVRADAGWLNSADRQFPVVIDPTIAVEPAPDQAQDAMVDSGAPTTNYGGITGLYAGTTASAKRRSLLKFDISSVPPGTTVDSAQLKLYFDQSFETNANAVQLEARLGASAWTESTVNWNSTVNTTLGSLSYNMAYVDDSHTTKTSMVGAWLSGTSALADGGGYKYQNDAATGSSFTWMPDVTETGSYDVYAGYLQGADRATNTPYSVLHGGGTSNYTVDQTQGTGNVLKALGSLPFNVGGGYRITMGDVAGKVTTADTMRLIKRAYDTKDAGESSVWHAFSVRNAVQYWLDGNPNNGLVVKATDETLGRGGPVYQASEYAYNGSDVHRHANRPKLVITYGRPGVTLSTPTTIAATGATLNWSAYADPSTSTADDIVEYQVHRSIFQNFTPTADTLVAPVATGTTTFVDTSAEPTPADDTSDEGDGYYYQVAVKTKDGGLTPSATQLARLPKAGQVVKYFQNATDSTLSSVQFATNLDKIEGKAWLEVGNNATYGKTRAVVNFGTVSSSIPAGSTILDAKLGLWKAHYEGGAAQLNAHALNQTFTESSTTWQKINSTTAWTTAGGSFGASLDYVPSANMGPDPTWHWWQAKTAVQNWVNTPGSEHGFLVKQATETTTGHGLFLSAEAAEPLLRPLLKVTYLTKTPESAYHAPKTPQRQQPAAQYPVDVTVTNTQAFALKSSDYALSYHWTLPDGTEVTSAANRLDTALPADLAPGAAVKVSAQVKSPVAGDPSNKREDFVLEWDLRNKVTGAWLSKTTGGVGTLDQNAAVEDPTSDQLGLEKFYQYAGKNTGAGSSAMVNLATGNVAFGYNALSNPSRGASTFVRMTYNSLDTSASSMGFGWSLSTSTLNRLGSALDFHPRGQKWPTDITLTDGDGTSHTFALNKHGTTDETKWDYDHPKGVHLYLQKVADPPDNKTSVNRAWVLTRPDRTQFFFDDQGFQSVIKDKNGNETRFTYEERKSANKPVKFLDYITDAAGRRTLTLDYFEKGQAYSYINDAGVKAAATNLTNPKIIDQVESITDISGRKVTFTYSDKGLMAEMVDGAGTTAAKTFKFVYDATNTNKNTKLVRITDPRGKSTNLSYFEATTDPKDKWKLEKLTDRLGKTTTFGYVPAAGSTVETTVTDATPRATKYVTDSFGRPVQTTNAKNETTKLSWDDDHNVTQLEEANGARSTWTYDPKTGFPLTIKDAEANANGTPGTVLSYNVGGNGFYGELIRKVSPEGRTWTFGYDPLGNLTSVTDPKGNATATADDYVTKYTYDPLGQLKTSTDANNNTTTYSLYHDTGYPTKITDPLTKSTDFTYDVRGNVLTVTDAKIKTSTYTYDLFGRPLTSKVPKDQQANLYITTPAPLYDANDNVTQATAPNGAISTNAYDDADQLISSKAPKDLTTDPDRETKYEYDVVGNLLRQTEPKGSLTPDTTDFVTSYSYDPVYQLLSVTNAQNDKISYSYDNVGNVVTVVDPRKSKSTDPDDFTSKSTYDKAHRPKTATDALGKSTSTEYDRDGNVISTTDADGNKTLVTLDERGKAIQVKAPHTKDASGNVVYRTTQVEYDQVGNQTKVISPRGVETTDDPDDFAQVTVYDALNRPKEKVSPYDKDDARYNTPDKTVMTYDEIGNVTKVSAPASEGQTVRNDTSYSYFDNGWVKSSTDPWDIAATYGYNDLGQQTARTLTSAGGSSSRTMAWNFFPDGKLKSRSDDGVPVGLDVSLVDNSDTGDVDVAGTWALSSSGTGFQGTNYRTHAAATGSTDKYTWKLNVPADGKYTVYVRYPAVAGASTAAPYSVSTGGAPVSKSVNQTTGAGTWVGLGQYTFAEETTGSVSLAPATTGTVAADAVKVVRDNTGEADAEKKDFTYTYDTNGNLLQITDTQPGAKVSDYLVSYSGLNQVAKVEEKKGTALLKTTTYTYNENGAPVTRSFDDAANKDDQFSSYTYDVRDLVDEVKNGKSSTDTAPKIAGYTHTARGETDVETKANGNTVDSDYYLDGLVSSQIEKKSNGTLVSQHAMEYSPNGDRIKDTAKVQNADNHAAYLENVFAYTFDPLDRIAKVEKKDAAGATVLSTESYTHDPAGNVVAQTVAGQSTSYSYDRNRLLTATTGGSTASYTYDPFGRLSQVSAGGKVIERNTYDGYDRIIKHRQLQDDGTTKTTDTSFDALDRTSSKVEGTKTTNYSYLGLSGEVLSEEVAGQVTASYQYSPWGSRLSQVKFKTDGTTEDSYYGYNPHSDVETLTSEGGDTRSTYGYTAYGKNDDDRFTGADKPEAQNPGKEPYNVYRFNAKRWDQSSESYDMGFRDYSPGLNRFLTRDAYTGATADLNLGTDPWTSNRYAFAGGNPITGVEIDGHYAIEKASDRFEPHETPTITSPTTTGGSTTPVPNNVGQEINQSMGLPAGASPQQQAIMMAQMGINPTIVGFKLGAEEADRAGVDEAIELFADLSGTTDAADCAYEHDARACGMTGMMLFPFGKLGKLAKALQALKYADEAAGAHRLIGANRAHIDPRKLTEYALNPNHPVGGNKARVFESALGFNRSNADDLMAQLRQGVMENTPIPGNVDKWGTRFTVDIPVTGPAGSGVVRTGWIYTPGSTTPSLNTLMVR
ncbi:DNRLRE domain-containing protein [Kribbella sp. VKM Ac-2568]|uniref:golvesin C-terminal-like domain-containing protein n=1 Tax=Kribbella sp. VKM Ac-2568 TaxID=2512219 RepID=UPI0010DB9DE8|nr:DNRLRE domain-containing protein [Kribbella sp. VKM Ac-2568]TCM48856.1 RHS repeat-associated protein [Kribbella sp. VKM Ac-2568]